MAFAGGKADWQGLDFWLPHMYDWLDNMPNLKLLLLTPENSSIKEIRNKFPNRVVNTFVPHRDVLKALSAGDYGILWRNTSTTNVVASPTKLSEYVQAGLTVVSNRGTSVSRIVSTNKLGVCVDPKFQNIHLTMFSSVKAKVGTFDFSKNIFIRDLCFSIRNIFIFRMYDARKFRQMGKFFGSVTLHFPSVKLSLRIRFKCKNQSAVRRKHFNLTGTVPTLQEYL